jgi:cholesterol transport system auxiliary component
MIKSSSQAGRRRFGAMVLVAFLLCGCSMLLPVSTPPPTLFSFDSPQPMAETAPAAPVQMGAPTLIVSIPRAATGFGSSQIVYIRRPHTFEYFRNSQWVDTPAGMISPLIVAALERSGHFSAVIQAPTSATGQLHLDVEIVRLQHEFLTLPSQVRFTLRAHLIDTATRQVVGWREFEAIVPSSSEDPYGGVLAANRAVAKVIAELAAFCGKTARNFQKIEP